MLFDLRGRGRRRTVQVIYVGLALLMSVGLIGFGVGGIGGGGGLLNAVSEGESGGASFSSQIKKYKKLTHNQPHSVYAWEQLTLAQLHEAGGEAYVSAGKLTSKGKELFSQVARSWNSYLALTPPKPNAELAQEMERVFGEEGLNEPAEAVRVLQIVIPAKSGSTPQYQSSLYTALAEYAYKAHNTRIGDLASEKAVSLAPVAQRKQLKSELAELKKNPSGTSSSSTASTSGAASTPGSVSTGGAASGSSGTVTIGGKTYPIKVGSGGAAGTSTAAKKK